MRPSRPISLASVALAALVLAGSFAEPAHARRKQAFAAAPEAPIAQPLVSLSLERPGGGTLPSFMHLGSLYFAGQQGERYDLRLTNNTSERVEVVVTVDGRDVISGELGNYKRQRGYVIEPWASVVVEGYRQSLDQVAAFRFSDPSSSYTAQRGSPEHAGVVGVAIFKEKRRSARKHRKALAAAPPPPPYYEPYYRGEEQAPAAPDAFPESSSKAERRAAASEAEAADEAAPARAPSPTEGGGFAPAPSPTPRQLGTAYGETRYSAVQEVEFKRHRRRRPDAFLTVYYDSSQGLAARGINVGAPALPYEPQPFPGYAAPPPR
ncbi:hypothetical protein [Paraliomyxa miuraensis]|uniref:hypothetical protein n=1 Tax=Paraliomyxa miuraensis TaxID=376150 RepID=UPI00225A042A|nr:hypothetical protein [Paraliomyxa miuraensis]MCX4246850.1 hypothetical protein [Paraliomyxa miuraensis]